MPRTLTIAQMIGKVRELADQQNSQNISDSEIQGWINICYAELIELYMSSGHRFTQATQTIALGASPPDPPTSNLSADYMGTLGVDWQESAGPPKVWIPVQELRAQERTKFAGMTGITRAMGFTIEGATGIAPTGTIILWPIAGTSQTYRHIYIPQPTDISALSTSSVVDVHMPAGEDFIVWGAARMSAIKEESNSEPYERNFERARIRIMESARNRIWGAGSRSTRDREIVRQIADAMRKNAGG